MKPLQYTSSLRDSGQSQTIRLIDLHSGGNDAPISCALREVSLHSKPQPQYCAISYCWGGQTPSVPITCDDAARVCAVL